MDKKRLNLWGPFLVVAAALVMLAVSTGAVDAARGGKGGGKPGPAPTTNATCWVTPNPVAQWALIKINGSGFAPYNSYGYDINGWLGFATADANGSFSTINQAPLLGTDTVRFSNGTTCTFEVY